MSPAPSAPAGSRKAEASVTSLPAKAPKKRKRRKGAKRRRTKIDWDAVKVFKKPEYRTPYRFVLGREGRNHPGRIDPWLRVAIESGLVEMGSLAEGGRVGDLLEPIKPSARSPMADRQSLEKMWLDGIADALKKLS